MLLEAALDQQTPNVRAQNESQNEELQRKVAEQEIQLKELLTNMAKQQQAGSPQTLFIQETFQKTKHQVAFNSC